MKNVCSGVPKSPIHEVYTYSTTVSTYVRECSYWTVVRLVCVSEDGDSDSLIYVHAVNKVHAVYFDNPTLFGGATS